MDDCFTQRAILQGEDISSRLADALLNLVLRAGYVDGSLDSGRMLDRLVKAVDAALVSNR
jgi:hypothetical protein